MRKMVLLMMLICMMTLPVQAHDVPDLTKQGSITVTMRYDGRVIAGGELTLYRVGDIREQDGNYSFTLSQEFADSGISLGNLQSAETAEKLAEFAAEKKVAGTTRTIGSDGTVCYSDLKLGLYLLVQKKAAAGFAPVQPFLVTLPMLVGESYHYQVDAGPKVSPVPEVKPDNPEQPKTGQSGMPIWTFSLSAIGLFLLTRKKK